MIQLSHPYITRGNTIVLTIGTFVSKVMSLLFDRLSRFIIAFIQSPSAVILETKKIKSVIVSIVFPSICHEVMGLDAMILVF